MKVLTKDPSVHWSSGPQRIVSDRPLPTIKRCGFQKTRWGWFPWCAESLREIVHPFDLSVAQRFIPGPRILTVNFCKSDPEFLLAHYGHLCFRIRPMLWREIDFPGFQLGDLVEVSAVTSRREPGLATVEEIIWDSVDEGIRFQLSRRGRLLPGTYERNQLNAVGNRSYWHSAS